MAYDEELADRIRAVLGPTPGLTEKRMFGGLAFIVNGHLAVTANRRGALMVRTDRDEADDLVAAGTAELVIMRGRPMRGWLHVAQDKLRTEKQLARWVDLGLAYAQSLPPK